MRSVRSTSLVAPVASDLLRLDLPALETSRRHEVVTFTCRRIDDLPSPTRAGVLVVAAMYRGLAAVPGWPRLLSFLAERPLPVLGEYVRLLRSLSTAYVWEHWPDTRPDGGPA